MATGFRYIRACLGINVGAGVPVFACLPALLVVSSRHVQTYHCIVINHS